MQKPEFDQDNRDQESTRKATEPKNRDLCHDKIRKTIKPKLSLRAENKGSVNLSERSKLLNSLKANMQIQQQDFNKALKDLEKENNESQRPWHVIKPKQKASSQTKLDKSELECKTQQSEPITTSNKFESLENLDAHVVETDSDEPIVIEVNKKSKETENNKSFHRQKKKDEFTVIMGYSMVKGLRQHSITKATKTKTLVTSFPGAKIKDLKHYCIPILDTKPKHAIHCGTNDLRSRSPQEITQQMNDLCDLIVDKCPNIHITVSSLITRNDEQDRKVNEVNTLLPSLCLEKNFSFLLHANIDKKCLNQSELHLNKCGDCIIAKNFIETIKHF